MNKKNPWPHRSKPINKDFYSWVCPVITCGENNHSHLKGLFEEGIHLTLSQLSMRQIKKIQNNNALICWNCLHNLDLIKEKKSKGES